MSFKSGSLGKFVILSLCIIVSQSFGAFNDSTRGKVVELSGASLQYLAHSFDQILVLLLEKPNADVQKVYEETVKKMNSSYPEDHTLYAVTFMDKDKHGKLEKYNKRTGFRIITKRNHYEMEFNHELKEFDQLQSFYSTHVHPKLPIFKSELQLLLIPASYFLVFEYNSSEVFDQFSTVYRQLYDYTKMFNITSVSVYSEKNRSKIHIYHKTDTIKLIATYANDFNHTEELIDFINVETLPLITQLNDFNYVRIFGSSLDTQLLLIFNQSNQQLEEFKAVREQLKQAAVFNRQEELKYQRILFAEATTSFLEKYFDESIGQMNDKKGEPLNYKIVLTKTDYDKFQLRRFNYQVAERGRPTKQSIIKFIEDVRMKRVDSEYKSQKIPTEEEQKENVLRKIVGDSFISEIYEKPNESIIVLFIDSKQPQSYKQIKEVFENFASKYKAALEGKVIPAIFDLAKNQHKLLSIKTAPTLSLFERTNKKSPKTFRGYQKIESIKNWINYEIKDFTIPQNFGEKILPLGAPSSPPVIQTQQIELKLQEL